MKLQHALSTVAAFTLIGTASIANADIPKVFFPTDVTVNYPVASGIADAYVGYANYTDYSTKTNPTSPTFSLVLSGSVNDLLAYNSSSVNVSGGRVGYHLFAFNSSTINVSDGNIGNYLYAEDSSTVNITGGSISLGLYDRNHSTVNVTGGSIGVVLVQDSSILNFTGGSIGGNLQVYDSSTVNITGGSIGNDPTDYLVAYDHSIINLFGDNLTATLVGGDGEYNEYALYGLLTDGTALNGKHINVQSGSGARFTFTYSPVHITSVPAPSSALVVLTGIVPLVGVLRKRRK